MAGLTAVALALPRAQSEVILLIGGDNRDSDGYYASAPLDILAFDPTTLEFSEWKGGALAAPRAGHASGLYKGSIVLAGGNTIVESPNGMTETLDEAAGGTFARGPDLQEARFGPSSATIGTRKWTSND